MTTKLKTPVKAIVKEKLNTVPIESILPQMPCKRELVDLALIDFCAFNRKQFKEAALKELAADIASNGVIQDIILRPKEEGRFECVAGERRIRASRIAKLTIIPAKIYPLTDAHARHIRFSENAHREDLHPMEEAYTVAEMLQDYATVDEIAAYLGKSKSFVYSRIKLSGLIEAIQKMFLADKFNIHEAFEIALLSSDSQTQFFEGYCKDWQKDDHFEIYNLHNKLSQYKYNLKEAPFNIRSKKLVPEAGACTDCPFNTFNIGDLFPSETKQSVCMKKGCFEQKCEAHFTAHFVSAFKEPNFQCLVFDGSPSAQMQKWMGAVPASISLPRYELNNIYEPTEPALPMQKGFSNKWEIKKGEKVEPDVESFNEAMEEYNVDLKRYQSEISGPKILIGLLVDEKGCRLIRFNPEIPKYQPHCKNIGTTAKEVAFAIQSGTATAELLQGEIERLKDRESRSQELDREKIQLLVHEQFMKSLEEATVNATLNISDKTATRWIVFDSISHEVKEKVIKKLFPKHKGHSLPDTETIYKKLRSMNDREYAYLIRMALLGQSDTKYPANTAAYFLYKMAESAGVRVNQIEKEQKLKTEARHKTLKEKTAALQSKIKQLGK